MVWMVSRMVDPSLTITRRQLSTMIALLSRGSHHTGAIRYVVNDACTSGHEGTGSDGDLLDHASSCTYMHTVSHPDPAGQHCTRRNMNMFPHHTIVVHQGAGIDD